MERILIYSAAIFFWVLLVISFLIDRSRYRNCYFLFLALASSVLALTFLAGEHQKTLLVVLFNIVIVTLLIVPIFLICNGVVMLRREGRSIANLLSLFFGIITPGYVTTMCAILFLGGLTEMSIGILGEYIGRIYMETKDRPIYITKFSNFEDENNEEADAGIYE